MTTKPTIHMTPVALMPYDRLLALVTTPKFSKLLGVLGSLNYRIDEAGPTDLVCMDELATELNTVAPVLPELIRAMKDFDTRCNRAVAKIPPGELRPEPAPPKPPRRIPSGAAPSRTLKMPNRPTGTADED